MPYLFVLLVLSCAIRPAEARTLTVGSPGAGDYQTIQNAIDSAARGDTVLVFPGRYRETLSIESVDIHLISFAGPASTIIDGGGAGPVIRCLELSPNSSIQGFMITGGVTAGPLAGGGIYLVANASPLIKGNIVAGNRAVASGGGASVTGGPPASGMPAYCEPVPGSGGGIFVHFLCRPTIVDNTIMDNEARRDGGGIVFWDHADAYMEGNRIYRNIAGRYGGGVFIGCNAMPVLEKNVVAWNTALSGGGLYLSGFEADAPVRRNTFYMNWAAAGAGGIHCAGQCRPLIHANLIGVAGGGGVLCDPESDPTVTCNVIWGAGEDSFEGGCFPAGVGYADENNAVKEVELCGVYVGDFRPCLHPLLIECGPVGAEENECQPGACGAMKGSWGLLKSLYRDP